MKYIILLTAFLTSFMVENKVVASTYPEELTIPPSYTTTAIFAPMPVQEEKSVINTSSLSKKAQMQVKRIGTYVWEHPLKSSIMATVFMSALISFKAREELKELGMDLFTLVTVGGVKLLKNATFHYLPYVASTINMLKRDGI